MEMTSGMRNVGPSFSICKINDDVLNEWLEEMEENGLRQIVVIFLLCFLGERSSHFSGFRLAFPIR